MSTTDLPDETTNKPPSGEMNDASKEDPSIAHLKNMSLFSYVCAELTRGYILEHQEAKYTEKRERLYTFIKIPRELEKFMIYGFFQCLDAFLYIFTFLPLRFLMALIKLLFRGCLSSCLSTPGRIIEPAQICDLIKGIILILCCVMIHYVDVSMMYHIVRGQSVIKLYIVFNMLEVFDRLFSSFGQDILDSLLWTATEPRGKKREHLGVIPHFLMAVLYVFLHAVLVLFQATTLNVAFNSHNKSLLTILISNNFVELKGSVFKKFAKNNLFQMSCSDVRERFHFTILLIMVSVRNLTEFAWNMEHLWVLCPDIFLVIVSEVLIDWVKHAFITKFNEIPVEVYSEYTVSIAYDMANSRQKNAFADHLDLVSRRMGFIPLPLAVLLLRIVWPSLKFKTWYSLLIALVFYLCLMSFKVLNSIVLLGKACEYIERNKEKTTKSKSESEKKDRVHTTSSSSDADTFRIPNRHQVDALFTDEQVENLAAGTPYMKRSQSLGEVTELSAVKEPQRMASSSGVESPICEQPSLTPRCLFSNSTVSLASVCLNEEYVRDREIQQQQQQHSTPRVPGIIDDDQPPTYFMTSPTSGKPDVRHRKTASTPNVDLKDSVMHSPSSTGICAVGDSLDEKSSASEVIQQTDQVALATDPFTMVTKAPSDSKEKEKDAPLSEINRFSMVSSQIM